MEYRQEENKIAVKDGKIGIYLLKIMGPHKSVYIFLFLYFMVVFYYTTRQNPIWTRLIILKDEKFPSP